MVNLLLLRQHNLANYLMIYGFLTLPLTYLVSKTVFVASYIIILVILALWLLNSANFLSWLGLLLSLVYLVLTAMLRPEYLEISFRLLTVIFIIISSLRLSYIYNSYKLNRLVYSTGFLGLFSALLGLKQFLFGYTDYEMIVAAKIGSVVDEFLTLNSARSMGISFDPLSQALLLGISFHCFAFIRQSEFRVFYKNIYLIAQFCIILSLLLTLNRAGIIAFILSLSIYVNYSVLVQLFGGISGIFRAIVFLSFLYLVFYILSLPEFDYPKRALLSVFELFGIGNDTDEFFNRSQSLDKRLSAAQAIIEFAKYTPFGIREEITDFTVNDVGILSPIFNYGLLGGIIIIALLYIPLVGLTRFYFTGKYSLQEQNTCRLIYSCYLVISISSLASFSLDGTIMMLPSWLIVSLALRKTIHK